MYGKKDIKKISNGKVITKETSDEYIETKPEALKASDKNLKALHIKTQSS